MSLFVFVQIWNAVIFSSGIMHVQYIFFYHIFLKIFVLNQINSVPPLTNFKASFKKVIKAL